MPYLTCRLNVDYSLQSREQWDKVMQVLPKIKVKVSHPQWLLLIVEIIYTYMSHNSFIKSFVTHPDIFHVVITSSSAILCA